MLYARLLREYFGLLSLAPIGLIAFFDARGLSELVGAGLAPSAEQLALNAPPRRASAAEAPFHSTDAKPILRRNPFDSLTGPLLDPDKASSDTAVAADDADDEDPWKAPACDGVTVSAIAASNDVDWSFAAVHVSTDPKVLLRRRGDTIGDETLEFVGWDRVWMTRNHHRCQASLFTPAVATAPASVPIPKQGVVRDGAHAVDPAILKGISRKSATEFDIERGIVDKVLESQAELMAGMRAAPELKDHKVVGLRLGGIRSGSLPEALGMADGDLLQTVNGFDITDPEKALEAYARLRTADRLELQVNRKGAPTTVTYNIK
ncbi:MAG TPA: type II secretion system protein GspC [Polyangiaceae bacterium]|jgi:general secretion pathway protein C